jgi:hypothetical protein
MAKKDERIESKELLVVKKVSPEPATGESKYGKNGFTIRVVQWLFEGKGKNKGAVQGSVSLEKREFYLSEDGDLRTGKAKGFTLEDMAAISPKWGEIVGVMKNAPTPEWPTGSKASRSEPAAVPEEIEEVPF